MWNNSGQNFSPADFSYFPRQNRVCFFHTPFNSLEKGLGKWFRKMVWENGICHLLKFDFKHSSESEKTSKQKIVHTVLKLLHFLNSTHIPCISETVSMIFCF